MVPIMIRSLVFKEPGDANVSAICKCMLNFLLFQCLDASCRLYMHFVCGTIGERYARCGTLPLWLQKCLVSHVRLLFC